MARIAFGLLGAVCAVGLGLGHAALGEVDAAALLQVDAGTNVDSQKVAEAIFAHRLGSGWPAKKAQAEKGAKLATAATKKAFNCSQVPAFCRKPFNCGGEPVKTGAQGHAVATEDGHPNFQAWCNVYPVFAKPMASCAAGKLKEYGHLMYAEQKAASTGPLKVNISNIDAQYCFMAGHCSNTKVKDGMNVSDMERMCDAKFGRDEWTTNFHMISGLAKATMGGVFAGKIHTNFWHPMLVTIDAGFSTAFAKLACAMGNYHCDVMYCKETYCKDEGWKALHGHLAAGAAPAQLKQGHKGREARKQA